jgi:hypothetical protein
MGIEECYLTVGRLKEFIKEHNIPDNAKVFYQRIEDMYFQRHGWTTVEKPWDDITSQYIRAWGCIKFLDDGNLYIDAHY